MNVKLKTEFSNQGLLINEDFCSRSRPAIKIIAGIFFYIPRIYPPQVDSFLIIT